MVSGKVVNDFQTLFCCRLTSNSKFMEDVLIFAQTASHMDSAAVDDFGCSFLNVVHYTEALERLCLNKYTCVDRSRDSSLN